MGEGEGKGRRGTGGVEGKGGKLEQGRKFAKAGPAFMGYSRLKLKVVKNRAEFWTFFFAIPNFRGQAFQNLYTFYHH